MAYLKIGDTVPTKGRGSRLTQKQLQFIEAFCDPSGPGYNSPTKAIKMTTYKTDNPTKMGMFLMQHPLVSAEIKERMNARKERMELSADYVIHKLLELVDNTEKDGDRIRALELLGKTLSLFKERQEISGPDGKAIEYEQKIKEDVNDFTQRLKRLAEQSSNDSSGDAAEGKGRVVKLPKRG